ncbi:hypothetical protein HOG48_05485 [Candidatus Peregrinibacteria bacterium]|nr:hypothetical protein [Candidatus Peregrinibacteria bacterium]
MTEEILEVEEVEPKAGGAAIDQAKQALSEVVHPRFVAAVVQHIVEFLERSDIDTEDKLIGLVFETFDAPEDSDISSLLTALAKAYFEMKELSKKKVCLKGQEEGLGEGADFSDAFEGEGYLQLVRRVRGCARDLLLLQGWSDADTEGELVRAMTGVLHRRFDPGRLPALADIEFAGLSSEYRALVYPIVRAVRDAELPPQDDLKFPDEVEKYAFSEIKRLALLHVPEGMDPAPLNRTIGILAGNYMRSFVAKEAERLLRKLDPDFAFFDGEEMGACVKARARDVFFRGVAPAQVKEIFELVRSEFLKRCEGLNPADVKNSKTGHDFFGLVRRNVFLPLINRIVEAGELPRPEAVRTDLSSMVSAYLSVLFEVLKGLVEEWERRYQFDNGCGELAFEEPCLMRLVEPGTEREVLSPAYMRM